MEVINDSKDMKKALKNKTEIVGCVGFSFKNPTTKPHHEGHQYLLQEAKKQCDILIAVYSQPNLFPNLILDSEIPELYNIDLNYCTTFCQQNNVDILYTIDSSTWKQKINKKHEFKKIEKALDPIKQEKGLTTYEENGLYGALVFHKHNEENWKKDKTFYSWSDGYLRFAQRELYKRENLPEVILIPPLRRPDGLIYSSSLINFDQDEIEIFKLIQKTFDKFFIHQNQVLLDHDLKQIDFRTNPTLYLRTWGKIQNTITGINNIVLSCQYSSSRLNDSIRYTINEFFENPWKRPSGF